MPTPLPPPQRLLDAVADVVIAADADNVIRYANSAVQRLLGWSPQELIGQSLLTLIPTRFRDAHSRGMAHHVRTGERKLIGGPAVRLGALHRDGHEIEIELSLSSLSGEDGELFVATLRDARDRQVLERRVAENRRLEAQFRLMALIAQTRSLQPVGRELLATLCEPLEFDLGLLWRVHQGRLRWVDAWSAFGREPEEFLRISAQKQFSAGEGLLGLVLQRGEQLFVQELGEDPRYLRGALAQRHGLRSALVVPVSSGNEVVAVIELISRHRLPPDPELQRTVSVLGGHVGQLMARLEAERHSVLQQTWLRTVVHSLGDAVVATDAQGRVVLLNPVAEQLTGWSHAQAVGLPLEEVFHIINEESQTRIPTPVAQVLEEGRTVALANHTLLIHRDGRHTPIEDSAAPIRDQDGNISGVVLIFRDVTLQRSAARARDFLSRASEVLTGSLDYQEALQTLTRLCVPGLADWCSIELGSDPRQTRQLAVAHVDPSKVEFARTLRQRFPTDPDAPHGVPAVIRTGKTEYAREIPPQVLEQLAKNPEQLEVFLQLGLRSYIVVPLTSHGRVLGALTLVSAESRRLFEPEDVRLAEELGARAGVALENALLFREATEASRLRDEFLATLSHELRTPLTSILGWTQMLRAGHHRADAGPRALETIERNTRSLWRLVEDLLDVSRAIRGQLSLEFRPVDLSVVVEQAVNSARPMAEARRISLEVVLPSTLPALVVDPDRLQQVLWNLLSNAVKFSPEGGSVQLRAFADQDQVTLSVSDQGMGISPAFLPYVFDRFRQADSSTTRLHGGLGLGLSLVKHLVEQHGGSVVAASEGLGKGARFTVRLPRVAPAAREKLTQVS